MEKKDTNKTTKIQSEIWGHIITVITVVIWGTTFVSTKILLREFTPLEILIFRFLIAVVVLYVIFPQKMPKTTKRQEFLIALAGLTGVCLYYLLENIALTYTLASNVGVISSTAPFITAIFVYIFLKNKEKINIYFFIGFIFAVIGISLISFNGIKIEMNIIGDILAIFSIIMWALYSIIMKKISYFGLPVALVTRKSFLYGIFFMIPALYFLEFKADYTKFSNIVMLSNMIYLGVVASALCFVGWNKGVELIGAIKTSIYLYLIPVVTVIFSVIILREPITPLSVTGTFLTICGLIIAEKKTNNV